MNDQIKAESDERPRRKNSQGFLERNPMIKNAMSVYIGLMMAYGTVQIINALATYTAVQQMKVISRSTTEHPERRPAGPDAKAKELAELLNRDAQNR